MSGPSSGVAAESSPEPSLPGIHCGLPWGLDRVTRLKVYEQKRVGIGLKLDDRNLGQAAELRRAECLAGDRNLIAVSAVVQYDILDAKAYLVRTADVPLVIENLATAELSAADRVHATWTISSRSAGSRFSNRWPPP